MKKPESLDDVLNVYREHGHKAYGEDVTELEHALQCASFAAHAGEEEVVIVSALLHDFGHLSHQLGEDIAAHGGDARHELIGYGMLRDLFREEVVAAGRLHVAAKRYLCRREPDYLTGLSEASRTSLDLQGGPMSEEEACGFEAEPHFSLAVRVRRYDDMGKVPGMETQGLDFFVPMLSRCLISAA
jgi:[1-hydroxy-2-(trimethylamino)ethyl]phosphonate dioxygenase